MDSPWITLEASNPVRDEIEAQFGSAFTDVRCIPLAPHGICYWNVDQAMRLHGGTTVLGWQFTLWPDRIVQATHHAIWKKPSGELLDISAHELNDTCETTTFLEDNTIAISLAQPDYVPSRFVLLHEHQTLHDVEDAVLNVLNTARSYARLMHRNGAMFWPGRGFLLSNPRTNSLQVAERAMKLAEMRRANAYETCARHNFDKRPEFAFGPPQRPAWRRAV